ncbi:hypothetical protein HPB49_008143 [Dermacentor silvarum]|uniref:Uncharacterized protein n=1 Tax=Dermacentor silvarum TaxID=543639 RepID=A0ACB8CE14_DERSI|nr:hypothetical protein HPB49_008143 [Dermacentor silvarum]
MAAQKPLLTNMNKSKRLSFAQRHEAWSAGDWGRVVFSDECTFTTKWDQRARVWLAASGRTVVSVWGCITRDGLGPLVRIQGALTADKYSNILDTSSWKSADDLWAAVNEEWERLKCDSSFTEALYRSLPERMKAEEYRDMNRTAEKRTRYPAHGKRGGVSISRQQLALRVAPAARSRVPSKWTAAAPVDNKATEGAEDTAGKTKEESTSNSVDACANADSGRPVGKNHATGSNVGASVKQKAEDSVAVTNAEVKSLPEPGTTSTAPEPEGMDTHTGLANLQAGKRPHDQANSLATLQDKQWRRRATAQNARYEETNPEAAAEHYGRSTAGG